MAVFIVNGARISGVQNDSRGDGTSPNWTQFGYHTHGRSFIQSQFVQPTPDQWPQIERDGLLVRKEPPGHNNVVRIAVAGTDGKVNVHEIGDQEDVHLERAHFTAQQGQLFMNGERVHFPGEANDSQLAAAYPTSRDGRGGAGDSVAGTKYDFSGGKFDNDTDLTFRGKIITVNDGRVGMQDGQIGRPPRADLIESIHPSNIEKYGLRPMLEAISVIRQATEVTATNAAVETLTKFFDSVVWRDQKVAERIGKIAKTHTDGDLELTQIQVKGLLGILKTLFEQAL